ncbi:MAG: DUF4062 domain-containing protein [Bryobacteraceae bacterium]
MVDSGVPRKYSIFLSSSFRDLQKARSELVLEILRIGHIPVGMEMFHAGDALNLHVIEKAIRDCDIFVLLVGARMGEMVGGGRNVAYVEWEYDFARKLGKNTIVFLLNKAEYDSVRNGLSKDDPERAYDKLLDNFRDKVQLAPDGEGKRIVDFFSYSDPGDLRAKLSDAIKLEFPPASGGWVPGFYLDELVKRVHFDETVSSNPFFRRFAKRLNSFGKLSTRTSLEEPLKRGISRYFWRLFLPRIALTDMSRLFFESGSSIAYVSEDFIRLVGEARWGRDLSKKLKIATNNILTFFDFALIEASSDLFNVSLEPKGPFEPSYGATFGELAEAVELPFPTVPEPLHPNARPYVDTVVANLKKFFDAPGMILMTASGVELDEASPFAGPHVGSYYNKLVKRALLEVKVPTVMFLDQAKFPYPFRPGECHSVCGPDAEWGTLRTDVPLAIASAFSSKDNRDMAADRLMSIGFESDEPSIEDEGTWPIIAGNREFKKMIYGGHTLRTAG